MQPRIITVQGRGHHTQAPDRCNISLKVENLQYDYAAAAHLSNTDVQQILEALKRFALPSTAVKVSDYNVERSYNYREKEGRQFEGYKVSYRVKISLPFISEQDRAVVSRVITALQDDTDALPEVDVSFDLSDYQEFRDKMLENAVKDARKKSAIIAAASGVSVKGVLDIRYGWGEIRFQPQGKYPMVMEADAAPEFSPDDIEDHELVTMVFEIE